MGEKYLTSINITYIIIFGKSKPSVHGLKCAKGEIAMTFLNLIARHHEVVALGNNMSFLRRLPEGVGHEPFCLVVGRVLDSTVLTNAEKVDQLMDIIHQNAGLLVDKTITRWFSFSKDEKLARIVWDSFVAMPAATDLAEMIPSTSQEAWVIKQMIAVLKGVGTPEELSAFAALALEKYPNIYGCDSKNNTLFGLAKYLRGMAGDSTPRRFWEFINVQLGQHQAMKPVVVETPTETRGEKVATVLQLAEQTEAERNARASQKPEKTNCKKKGVVKVVGSDKEPDNAIRGLDALNGLNIGGVTLVVPQKAFNGTAHA